MFDRKISRRVKGTTIAAVAVAGVLALGSQFPGDADAAIDPFVPYAALTNPELADLRGGFNFNGFDFDIAIKVSLKSFINDTGLVSVLVFNGDGGIESNSTTFFPGPGPDDGQTVEVTEGGVETTLTTETTEIVHELNTNTFKSIVSTSGNSQNIINTAQFDLTISKTLQDAVDKFSSTILSTSIGSQVGLSSLF